METSPLQAATARRSKVFKLEGSLSCLTSVFFNSSEHAEGPPNLVAFDDTQRTYPNPSPYWFQIEKNISDVKCVDNE
jgi:hypothetical protein